MDKHSIEVDLDKKRIFKLDLNAVSEIQKKTALPASELGKLFADMDKDITKVALLFWACLKHEDENLTEENIMSMSVFKLADAIEKIIPIFEEFFGSTILEKKKTEKTIN